jgi:glycosyltransferase involved in cell wall biosynthesis
MDISIVSGTYNRIDSLKRMVRSVRKSLQYPVKNLYGFSYEIVLVDGGSNDGTQEWCKNQSDINLIEHGELKGAVKAFNDGAIAARGKWVILANDDIEFVENSIYESWLLVSDIENLGMGCFYQNRDKKDWHVEGMPVVIDGEQANLPYGQVCIVPKWLGDKVGWWGDYLHTYGGDNELTSKIYELGFKVQPFVDCKIKDHEIDDGLRKINNIEGKKDPKAVLGHHPDSFAWGKRWKKGRLVGPIVSFSPKLESQTIKKNRVLYLPIYEQGWTVQKEQKRGLREGFVSNNCALKELDYFEIFSQKGKNYYPKIY